MKIKDVFVDAIKLLKCNDSSKIDVKILLSYFLGVDVNDLFNYFEHEINEIEFNKLLQRRINKEPVANIIGRKCFWNSEFYVNENVLTPRPDSETLIKAVMDFYTNFDKNLSIIDLGTGSGCLILTLLNIYKNANGVAVDMSEKALEVAKKNATLLECKQVTFLKNNWNDNMDGRFDVIISNPPYIETATIQTLEPEVKIHNPLLALDGGNDGLECYRYLARNLRKNIKKNTKIFLEIGQGQTQKVLIIFEEQGYKLAKIYRDMGNIERVLVFE